LPLQDPRWLSVLQKARRNRALARDASHETGDEKEL